MSADGPILDAMTAARNMLADCHWWRRVANPDSPWDQATARSRIHFDGLPPADPGPDHSLAELTALRPFALMWTEQAAGFRLRNDTAGYCCAKANGVIVVQIELPVPPAMQLDPHALGTHVSRLMGLIIRTGNAEQPGLFELSGLSGYLPLNEIQLYGYVRSDEKAKLEIGDVVWAELQLSWGLE